ncbi:ABC transporter permease [Pigmentiphaga sp. GD03639]|uniref:Iron export ABC transporter permease subunit FetB n=1 Tax=Pigmentiphaga daeguensis TaxID=414049 RepID=A0ABN1B7F0_9BURK|nr:MULTISPECIES: ABC transporter permease [unclassified Pigmentiphaga]MDH2235530.1 ABC transporter permease [Pigmentiphaga sp. GD03639]OVZ61580.1 ABC transporter permease [Pigmentiphaga sp. NML030171]
MSPISLTPMELAMAAVLVLASAALSLRLALGIQRPLLVAAARMVVQLVLVGLFLRQVFALTSPWVTGAVVALMIAAACHEVGSRQERRFQGAWRYGVGGVPVGVATLGIALLALATALRPDPWYDPRHAIPLAGIVLGTAMNSASLALNGVFTSVSRERAAIEARLALGADRYTAFRNIIRGAVRAGVLPVMNQMAAAGVITMPGIMTGQILAGMDPIESAKYQILLMFLLAGGGFAASAGSVYLAVWRLTDARDRLRLERLVSRHGG